MEKPRVVWGGGFIIEKQAAIITKSTKNKNFKYFFAFEKNKAQLYKITSKV